MSKLITNVEDVARWRLCVGCGACAALCSQQAVQLRDITTDGIRPSIDHTVCIDCGQCLRTCPGYDMRPAREFHYMLGREHLHRQWGPILEIWEGHAVEPTIRHLGSSSGMATALALYCMEHQHMHATVHTAADPQQPWRNRTVISQDLNQLLAATGSRYSPAGPCEAFTFLQTAPQPCVFIGKPCDITALRMAARLRPDLRRGCGIAIGIFCAGTPATQATLQLLAKLKVAPEDLEELRYRGKGWPGYFAPRRHGENHPSAVLSYEDAWADLQAARPFRCYLCPDGTSEYADLACGDAWHRRKQGSGTSLLIIRSELGRRIAIAARAAGYIMAEPVAISCLQAAQDNLRGKRQSIWGRLLAMRLAAIPTPHVGYDLFYNWLRSPILAKLRSVFATWKRIRQRQYKHPLPPTAQRDGKFWGGINENRCNSTSDQCRHSRS